MSAEHDAPREDRSRFGGGVDLADLSELPPGHGLPDKRRADLDGQIPGLRPDEEVWSLLCSGCVGQWYGRRGAACPYCLAALNAEEVEHRFGPDRLRHAIPAGDRDPAPDTAPDWPGDPEPVADDGLGDRTLGEEFWSSLPVLAHVRTAARARRVAPTAVLGNVLARVAAWTPPAYSVPAFVGGTVPLSLFVALIGQTSEGKSAPDRVAADLVGPPPATARGPLALGTGPGAVEAYLERFTDTDDDGRKVTRMRQAAGGVLFSLDEGRVLADLDSRAGSTTIPTLCSLWTGGAVGQQNASAETVRHLSAGTYAAGLVSLWQPSRMGGLFDDADGGLPGRFLFLGLGDPDAPDTAPDWPGALDWKPPRWVTYTHGSDHADRALRYPDDVVAEVDAERVARLRGEVTLDPLDGHRTLLRLKVAGVLAQLDGSPDEVRTEHWNAAGALVRHSDRQRRLVLETLAIENRRREEASHARAARREVTIRGTVEQRALDAGARAIGRKAHKTPDEVLPKRVLTQAIAGPHRKIAGTDACIDEADRLGYIERHDGGWQAGKAQPA